jgi:hypothetical protein
MNSRGPRFRAGAKLELGTQLRPLKIESLPGLQISRLTVSALTNTF